MLQKILRIIHFRELIAAIPTELKAQFEQMQLKNSLYRLKLLSVIIILFKALNWFVYIFHADKLGIILFHKIFFIDICQLSSTVLFFILTGCFSKKGKDSALWFVCYLFVAVHSILFAYSMLFVDAFMILQVFLYGIFFYAFAPDFRPKIFISVLILWSLAATISLTYNGYTFALTGPQLLVLNIFLITLVVRILLYNNKVKIFIDISRINILNEKLNDLSVTDELTKLNNRRSFVEYMDIIWKQNHRLNLPITVLMIDVDYFKKYNDSMGHLEGDKTLIAIAQCMKNHVKRETDFVARFGGEEFVCLLPFIEKDDAVNFAKTLAANIENMQISHPMSEISKYVTVSIGMASAIPGDHNSSTKLLDEADKALYVAKKSGRNRVEIGL